MAPLPVDPAVIALFVAFWVAMSWAWAPFLAARSVRGIFDGWPTRRLPVNYAFGMGVLTFAHSLALLAVLFVATLNGGVNLMRAFELAVATTLVVVAVAWTVVAVGLPRLGYWDPRGDGYDGRAVLVGGAVWYLVCTVVVAAIVNTVAFLWAFPDA